MVSCIISEATEGRNPAPVPWLGGAVERAVDEEPGNPGLNPSSGSDELCDI